MKPNWKCPFCTEVFEYFGQNPYTHDTLVMHLYDSHNPFLKVDSK